MPRGSRHRIEEMPPRDADHPSLRRLFVAPSTERGSRTASLHEDDVDHALRVLRLRAGDEFVALDGRGHSWRARVAEVGRREVAAELLELVGQAPRPGSGPGAALHVTVFTALPKPGPAEELVDRLTQLGAAAIVPLLCERAGPHARELSSGRRERFERIAREAAKQSGNLWLPEIGAPVELASIGRPAGADALAVLSPRAETGLIRWANERRAAGVRRIAIVVGPEGGLTDDEEKGLVERGAERCRIARSILRIETASEAAMAVLAALEVDG